MKLYIWLTGIYLLCGFSSQAVAQTVSATRGWAAFIPGKNSAIANDTANPSDILKPQSTLPGKLLFEQGSQAWEMKIATGTHEVLNEKQWDFDESSVDVDFTISTPQNGDEFVVYSTSDCFGTFGSQDEYCLQVRSRDNELRSSHVSSKLKGRLRKALLSPDQKYILLVVSLKNTVYMIVDRRFYPTDGKALNEITNVDWLPDNSLVLANDKEIRITNPLSLKTQKTINLAKLGLSGVICEIDTSPRGSRLLIGIAKNYLGRNRRCMPWIVNLANNSAQQLAKPTDPSVTSLSRLEWSPDGKWVYMQSGGSAGTRLVNTSPRGYVVPSALKKTPYVLSRVSDERSSEVIPLYRNEIIGKAGSYREIDSLQHEGFPGRVYWIY